LIKLSQHLEKGAKKYAKRNWEIGFPLSRTLDSLLRHILQFMIGDTSEDHLTAIACNIMFIQHTQFMVEHGKLPKELHDMPKYDFDIKTISSFPNLNLAGP
jgi:hypothetical protein